MDLIPGLPEDLGLECLTRLSYTTHRVGSQVCQQWQKILESREFYHHRKRHGFTREVACLVQSLLVDDKGGQKLRAGSASYGITVFDPESRTWFRLDPIPSYPNGLPLFCQVAGCEGKLIMMGGWDPASYEPLVDVFVYDFTTSRWKQGKSMPSKRTFFAIGAIGCHVYIAGGHDENKNALKSAWTYDLRRDEWTELTRMSQERDECEGLVIRDEFHVVSGYPTESQGVFVTSIESYQPQTSRWNRVDGAWEASLCPRSCVKVGKDGKLLPWPESESKIQVGVSTVRLGARTLLTGAAYQGAPQRFFLHGMNEKEYCESEIEVPNEFRGFVQSSCSVEI